MSECLSTNSAAVLISVIALFAGARPALAHHAFAAEYDARRQVILTGSVAKIDWSNPHAHLLMNVKEGDGTQQTWDLELASPNTLERAGWNRKSVKIGDVITVNGYLAKDGTNLAHAHDVWIDGRKVLTNSGPDGGPTQ